MMKSYEIEFKEIYGKNYEYKYFAPGRTNIIGEHVDYNGGHVLPIAINLGFFALVSKRKDKKFSFFFDDDYESGVKTISLDELDTFDSDKEYNYPKAILKAFKDRGCKFDHGLNFYFYTTLEETGGVAHKACLQVVTATAICDIYNFTLSPLEVAMLCHKASVSILGMDNGVMNQCSIVLGKENQALYLNTFLMEYEYVPFNLKDYSLVVLQTNKRIDDAAKHLKKRIRECQRAFDIIKNNFNINNLASIPDKYLDMIKLILPNETLYKRVLHVHNEEKRVKLVKEALLNDDIDTIARCINDSHESLRDLYEVSCKELDTIVSLARNEQGCICARMTGSGFGGCAIALVYNDFLQEFKENISKKYFESTGIRGAVYEIKPISGPRRLPKEQDSIEDTIVSLVQYALNEGLIEEEDKIYCFNRLIDLLKLDEIKGGSFQPEPLYMLLDSLTDYAITKGIIEAKEESRETFETKAMDIFIKKPSEITSNFNSLLQKSSNKALEYFYNLSRKSNYIRTDKFDKDASFKGSTKYGNFLFKINMSRPELSPTEEQKEEANYPVCALCKESVGYSGRPGYHSRVNHRVIPMTFAGEAFVFQYSPYPYFEEHSLLINQIHKPIELSRQTFEVMTEFVDTFNDYFIGANADLPIVGGSINNHEHYHTGRYSFPIENAKVKDELEYDGIKLQILDWPATVLRLVTRSKESLISFTTKLLNKWRKYDDYDSNIIANDGENHNTITPILRKNGEIYYLIIALRNNRTSETYPLGIFHPHSEYLHIKKENIGLFEIMGYGVLPPRLKEEMSMLEEAILRNSDVYDLSIEKHKDWALNIASSYKLDKNNIKNTLTHEIAQTFVLMLEDCAVYKNDSNGEIHLKKFINTLIK